MASLPDCPSLLGQFRPTRFLLGGWADVFKQAGVSERLQGLWDYAPEAHGLINPPWQSGAPHAPRKSQLRRARRGGAGESAVTARPTPQPCFPVKREVISSTELLGSKQERSIGPGSIHTDGENQTTDSTAVNFHMVLFVFPSLCDKLWKAGTRGAEWNAISAEHWAQPRAESQECEQAVKFPRGRCSGLEGRCAREGVAVRGRLGVDGA